MKKKSHTAGDFSPFSYLPDEIVLEIISKIIDLKTLYVCKLVSRRLLCIVHKVNAISFTVPSKPDGMFPSADEQRDTFHAAVKSLRKFTTLKSLCIHHPASCVDNDLFSFKWKVKFNTRVNSFVYLSPSLISDNGQDGVQWQILNIFSGRQNPSLPLKRLSPDGEGEEEEYGMKLIEKKLTTAMACLKYVIERFKMLHLFTSAFPLLEKVSIKDSSETRSICFSGGEVDELRSCCLEIPDRVRWCHVPLLELPVSGYVMKGATLLLVGRDDMPDGNDIFMNIDFEDDGFEDEEEVAYNEAVTEIFSKHKARIEQL